MTTLSLSLRLAAQPTQPCSTRERVLAFIVAYKAANDGCAPTIRQICAGVGLHSTSHASYHLQMLERDGRIVVDFNKSRSIRVVGATWTPPSGKAGQA